MKKTITVLVLAIATIGCTSTRCPVPMNAYICPEGREAYIRNGFPKIAFPCGTNEVIQAIGYPERVLQWRAPVPMFSLRAGERLGTKWEYWIQWAEFRDDRWLEFYFDHDSNLVQIGGNLDGKYFRKPEEGPANHFLQRTR